MRAFGDLLRLCFTLDLPLLLLGPPQQRREAGVSDESEEMRVVLHGRQLRRIQGSGGVPAKG